MLIGIMYFAPVLQVLLGVCLHSYLISELFELLYFKTASHILHLASLLFFSWKFSHTGLESYLI